LVVSHAGLLCKTMFTVLIGCAACFVVTRSHAGGPAPAERDGTIHVPAFLLPQSSLLSLTPRPPLSPSQEEQDRDAAERNACASLNGADPNQAAGIRQCGVGAFYASSYYKRLRDRYSVKTLPQEIGGVHTEAFIATQGVAARNRNRVLIDLHGGAFLGGWGINSEWESVPVASLGRFRVISVDYREGPEHTFPAGSEDVAAVYRQLLKRYKAANIGIFGCSAGALMTAEAVAWFQKEKLPTPGAIAMLCGGATYWSEGDSAHLGEAVWGSGLLFESAQKNPYFMHTTPNDALAFPVRSASIMGKFPPCLLITGTRDFALSSAVYTHSVLVSQGVDAELHVWEGLGHGFMADIDLPESRAAYEITVRFFDTHLAR
jgi:monoterpene epsilon-lactone hydrolase